MIRSIRNNKSAFTLVEIMIVVAIIGLLAALALPAFAKARRQAMQKAFVENLRVLEGGILTHAQTYGRYPSNTDVGVPPGGMSADDFKISWLAPTPMRGQWDYDEGIAGCDNCKAAITCRGASGFATTTDATWQEIDALIDDGDLTTGRFRVILNDRYTYIIEP